MNVTSRILCTLLVAAATSVMSAQPSMSGGQPPMGGGQPPQGGQRPPRDGQRPEKKDASKKKENTTVDKTLKNVNQLYVYGIAYSPKDSVVHLTDMLFIKNAKVAKKTGFLENRTDYSNQLKTYLESHGDPNRTCVLVYNEKLGKLSKDYEKMVERYSRKKYNVKIVNQTDFRFSTVGE